MLFKCSLVSVALGFANAASLAGSQNAQKAPRLARGATATERVPNLSGSSAGGPALAWNALDYELIRNALARYSYSLDDKDYGGLSTVYTEDIKIYYPEPIGLVAGLGDVTEMIESMLESVTTQHSLTTQNINILDYRTATVKTYGRAVHFGTGELANQSVTLWVKYEDKVLKVNDDWGSDW